MNIFVSDKKMATKSLSERNNIFYEVYRVIKYLTATFKNSHNY